MQKIGCTILYRKLSEVNEGDEFFQLTLSKDMRRGNVSYSVDGFHDLTGHLPLPPEKLEPESNETFPALQEAREFFDKSVRILEEAGFVQYDSRIHGQDRAFKSS